MAIIHYLNWARERGNQGPATELFFKLAVESALEEDEKPPQEFSDDEFEMLYRALCEVDADTDKLEKVLRRWNRGSRYENQEFLEFRYCPRCDSYIKGREQAIIHASDAHGYDALGETGEPDYIRGIRSMSVGDVIQIRDRYFQVKDVGFGEINVPGRDIQNWWYHPPSGGGRYWNAG